MVKYSTPIVTQPSPNTHCGSAPPRALPSLNLLQLFLVLANHICERRHVLVRLLQQVRQTLVFLVVNHLTISLLILRLCEESETGIGVNEFYACMHNEGRH